ncbi:Transposable element Tc1 transposase [Araneus ventricosus]|uniref:Transposable element Tc1 transposase n=1 Tax=Araneus ventricosus TaxID=182803 RepID=A0A4Y2PMA3_ARAVE|nr:Transposable element Tc1 transposase [Araneus ventricosus]
MSFGVMNANTCCLVRMGCSGFAVPMWFLPQVPDSKNGGGNVMVWGCVSRLVMGPLRRIQAIMDKFQYEDIIENSILPYASNSLGRGFIFQQDNNPKHRYKHIQNLFSRRHNPPRLAKPIPRS